MADESREDIEWISLSSSWRAATGHLSVLMDTELRDFKRQLDTSASFFPPPWGNLGRPCGEVR